MNSYYLFNLSRILSSFTYRFDSITDFCKFSVTHSFFSTQRKIISNQIILIIISNNISQIKFLGHFNISITKIKTQFQLSSSTSHTRKQLTVVVWITRWIFSKKLKSKKLAWKKYIENCWVMFYVATRSSIYTSPNLLQHSLPHSLLKVTFETASR